MLTETKPVRRRTRVDGITDDGKIHCHTYPTSNTKQCYRIDPNVKSAEIDVAKLAIGTAFDLLLIDNEVVAISSPEISPFDIKTLYPQGLTSLTATINKAAEGIYGAATATKKWEGQELTFRIDTLTMMFQAQADDELKKRILKGLKPGDSVNLQVDLDAPVMQTGDVDAINVVHVKYMSVNYR